MSDSRLSSVALDVEPFRVMALLARGKALEAQGHRVLHLEIGEPDFPTPAPVVEAGQRALAAGLTHYTPAAGLPALREAIAQDYRQRYGLELDPRRVFVTPGASGALQVVLGALVAPGREVLLTDPGYPCNRQFVRLHGGVPVSIAVDASTNGRPDAQDLARHLGPRCAALLIASPANPTGAGLGLEALERLRRQVSEAGAVLIVDEIYQGLEYGDAPLPTALSLPGDSVVVINSFSKFYGMTGWRLGWAVVPDFMIDTVERLAQNVYLAASTLSQHAALAAFAPQTRAILAARRQELRARRDVLWQGLRDLGFDVGTAPPQGAFYIYANIARFGLDGETLSERLLEEVYVAITPGSDFGMHRAREHVRFAYTQPIPVLEDALQRIARWLGG
ncbi:MAG: aminotransferase class I/II-fold pyridoxal phosphate-dependent enzyme [Pseudomonadota bacterium]